MKFKKLLSCLLSAAMLVSTFTALQLTASAETFNDTVIQTVFELNAAAIKAGNVPEYVNVNMDILDTTNTSTANGVLSKTVSANTNFIQIDLEAAGLSLAGTDLNQYSLEIITDLTDSDDTTKNGVIMYMNTETVNDLVSFRARETSDFCVVNDNWIAPNWNTSVKDGSEAHYTITDLNLTTGAATSHLAQRMTANGLTKQYSATVAHNTPLSAWDKAPINGITLKVPNGYRASIDTFKITRKASFTSTDYVKDAKTVYELNVEDVLANKTTSGVVISNVDKTNSSATNGLISNQTTSSTDFMTITFDDLPQIAGTNQNDEMTPIYDVNMEFAFVDSDSTTKNGAWMFFDEVKDPSNMLLRIRETRDGTIYNNGSSTINNGSLGNQKIPTIYYNFKVNTDTGLLNQHFMKSATEYVFGNVLSRGNDINLGQSVEKIILKTPNYSGESYRVVLKSLKITRTAYIENAQYTITAISESEENGTVTITGLTDGKVQKCSNVTLTATPKSGYVFKGWYKSGEDVAVSTESSWTFVATENASYVAKFALGREISQTVYELDSASLEAGTVPTGVTLNTSILDENASTAEALVSDVVAADTAFLTIDLGEVSKTLHGEGTGIYTIELVTNVNDSDDTTNNGTTMYLKGTNDMLVFRARESSDICAMPNSWANLHWQTNTGATATYIMEELNVADGSAKAHHAKRDDNYQYSGYANGCALVAGNASEENPISVLTVKAAKDRRANIKSLKITRKAMVESATCTVNATTENAERGSVAISGVSQEEATFGQVQSGNSVTLTATRNPGYLFKGWYKGDSDIPVSTDSVYTFTVEESANYTARFVESYIANKVIFELDVSSLEAGTVPAGVKLNKEILDEAATTDSLVSDVVTADTELLTIDLAKVGINTGDIGGDIYTIELVTNVNDSDSTTNNGTTMYLKGTSDMLVFRARESSDICAMPNTWTNLYWQANTGATATYIMEELDVTDGSAKAHHAKRGDSYQYSAYANGCALAAGNASEETPISVLTVKAAKNYRANVKKLVITRQVEIPLERVNVEVTTENDAYGIVTDIGDTAIKYSEITLKAEAKEGYIFAGWYDGNTLVSNAETWTFQVTEGFSYTARFRKVIEEWVEVYDMNVADILAGETVNGVAISNLDKVNSSAFNGLLSAESDASTDFMTITFANLPTPETEENDVLTDIYRVDMKLNFVDEDDSTKNGALVYYNEAKTANMLARARETRDGTFYKDGSATIYGGTVGSQLIPVLAYNFKMDTETGLFNQYVKHGVGDYYLFTDTASRGDDITLPTKPEKIIIRNADYNSGGVNENYVVSLKSLSVKRLVRVVDTGNAVPVFSKDRVSVIAKNGEVWSGYGTFTTDVDKIVIDFGSEIAESEITNDTVFITCDDVKIDSTASATTSADGSTLVTITGMTFENGKTYKIIADGIKNVRGASLQKQNEYVAISTESAYEGIFIKSTSVDSVANIAPNTNITVNIQYSNVDTEKDVYIIYVAYKGDTKVDVKMEKVENVSGSGNKEATITTGDVIDVENVEFIIWEGWNSMKLFDSFGF